MPLNTQVGISINNSNNPKITNLFEGQFRIFKKSTLLSILFKKYRFSVKLFNPTILKTSKLRFATKIQNCISKSCNFVDNLSVHKCCKLHPDFLKTVEGNLKQ